MKRRRESFVHRSRNVLSLRAIWDFPIPHCSKCKARMVRFRMRWACRECTKVDMVTFVDELIPTIDGGLVPTTIPKIVKMSIAEAYPNRAMRRRDNRSV